MKINILSSCFAFVVKDWAKLHLKINMPSKLYRLLIAIFHWRSGNDGYQPWWFLGTVSYMQTCWLPLATKISAWNFYLLFKLRQDCFAELCIFLFPYFRTYCMNMSHAILDNIKHFQKAEPDHCFYHTNWWLKICIWLPYFSSWSPKGDLTIFLILSPGQCDSIEIYTI